MTSDRKMETKLQQLTVDERIKLLRPEAEQDLAEAAQWYQEQRPALSASHIAQANHAKRRGEVGSAGSPKSAFIVSGWSRSQSASICRPRAPIGQALKLAYSFQ